MFRVFRVFRVPWFESETRMSVESRISNLESAVLVALSGGVDSSVAALLLVEQGLRVSAVMLRLWSEIGRASCRERG